MKGQLMLFFKPYQHSCSELVVNRKFNKIITSHCFTILAMNFKDCKFLFGSIPSQQSQEGRDAVAEVWLHPGFHTLRPHAAE